jgi:hypothetical protein
MAGNAHYRPVKSQPAGKFNTGRLTRSTGRYICISRLVNSRYRPVKPQYRPVISQYRPVMPAGRAAGATGRQASAVHWMGMAGEQAEQLRQARAPRGGWGRRQGR